MGGIFHAVYVSHSHAFSPCCDAPDLSSHMCLTMTTATVELIVTLKVVHRTSVHNLKAVQVVANHYWSSTHVLCTMYSTYVRTYVQYAASMVQIQWRQIILRPAGQPYFTTISCVGCVVYTAIHADVCTLQKSMVLKFCMYILWVRFSVCRHTFSTYRVYRRSYFCTSWHSGGSCY